MIATSTIAVAGALLAAPASPVELHFLHSLAESSGVLPLAGVTLAWEPTHKELFVTGNGLVRVFNERGMQTYEFGEDPAVGGILAAVPLANGEVVALSHLEGRVRLIRVDFRGEPLGPFELSGLPAELEDFVPTALRSAQGKLYLADAARMVVVVADPHGAVQASYDLARLLELEERRSTTGLRGFNVDADGNLLVTIQPLFKAFVIQPDGTARGFGTRGSTAGKFNVLGGITRDREGLLYVADILRSVVMVFTPDFKFLREVGYRGSSPHNLAAPDEVVAADGKLFVANNARRGVSVFKVLRQE